MTNEIKPEALKEASRGRKILGVVTGLDSLGASVRHNVAIPAKIGFDLVDSLRQIFVAPDRTVESKAIDAKKRFADAMKQFGVSEADLKERQRISHLMFNTCMTIASIVAFLAFCFIDFHAGFFHVVCQVAPALSCFILFSVAMLKWGFDNYRLRTRSMIPFSLYIRHPKMWMTVKSGLKMLVGLSVASCLLGTPVMAQTSDGCTSTGSYTARTMALPCDTDVYRNAIENIFPAVGPLTEPNITLTGQSPENTNGKSGLQEALTAFTSVLMSTAMLLLSFHIVATLVSVSQEGSLLSQKWSLVWAPIRLSLGVGFLVPIKSGFCLAQIIVLYVALWGGSLANIIWVSYLNGMENPQFSNSAQVPYMSSYLRDAEIEDLCYTTLDRVSKIRQKQGVEALNVGVSKYPDGLPSGPYSNPRKVSGFSGTYAHQITSIARSDQSNDGVKATLTSWMPNIGGSADMTMQYNIWDFGVCGSIKIPTISDSSATTGAATTSDSAIQRMLAFDKTRLSIFSQFLSTMHTANTQLVNNTVNVASAPSQSRQAMTSQLVATYNKALTTATAAATKATVTFIDSAGNGNIEKLNEAASKYGWVTAGAFYMNISRMQGMTNQFLNMMPQADSYTTNINNATDEAAKILGTTGDASSTFNDAATAIIASYDSYSACKIGPKPENCGDDPRSTKSAASISDDLYKNASKAGNFNGITTGNNLIGLDNPSNGIGELFDFISKQVGSVFYALTAAVGADNTSSDHTIPVGARHGNPGSELQALVDFGQNIICLVEIMWAIIFIAKKVSGTTGKGLRAGIWLAEKLPTGAVGAVATAATGVAKMVAWGGGIIKTVLTSLFFVGIIHAYVLPMLPFIQFTMFVVSMLIIVVEAMIAAPIWAFMHIRLDGNELIMQQQKTGYMLMFNLFLRAPLGMLGMLLSISVFNASMLVMSITFWPAVQSACGEGSAGIIGMMVMLVLMSYMHYQLALRSFSLISAVPSRVSKWFGAGMTDENEHSIMSSMGSFMAGSVIRGQIAPLLTSIADKKPDGQQQNGGNGGGAGNGGRTGSPTGGSPTGDVGDAMDGVEESTSNAMNASAENGGEGAEPTGGSGGGSAGGRSSGGGSNGSGSGVDMISGMNKIGNARNALGDAGYNDMRTSMKNYMSENGGSIAGFDKGADAARLAGDGASAGSKMEAIQGCMEIAALL